MTLLLTNLATSSLAAGIAADATSITVSAGDGAKFPVPNAEGEWFPLLLVGGDGLVEIVRCTARFGDALTIARAQEGTAAKAFVAGDRVDLRITAAGYGTFADKAATLDALGKRVRVDTEQALSDPEKAQARTNIGANDAASLTAGTVPNARLSGDYTEIGGISGTGIASFTLEHTSGYFRMHPFSSGHGSGYAQMFYDATNRRIRCTPVGDGAGAITLWDVDLNGNAGTATTATYCSRQVIAGDGVQGGGALTANRTLSVDSTVVRTTGTQNISGVKNFTSGLESGSFPVGGYYSGSSQFQESFPLGHQVIVTGVGTTDLNDNVTIQRNATGGTATQYIIGSSNALNGTWRYRGGVAGGTTPFGLFQRTA